MALVVLASCPGETGGSLAALTGSVEDAVRWSRSDAVGIAEDPARLDGAGIEARAGIIDVLMRGSTGNREERAILEVLRRTPPLDRARLARRIDAGDDHYDLAKLVFDDIDDETRRREALALLREADEALESAGLLEIGVVSDIDDTAIPTDFRPDGREAFADAAALYRSLESGPEGSGAPGDVHFVTGRPPLVAGEVRGLLRRAGMPAGTVDTGDLGGVIFGGVEGIAREKVRDIERLLALHPRQRFVFLGDDRQRDPEVYREIARRFPDRVEAIYIHRAGGSSRRPEEFPGAVFFDRYSEL